MTLKGVIRGLTPPLLRDAVLAARGPKAASAASQYVWEGIYDDRRHVPTVEPVYDVDARVQEMIAHATQERAALEGHTKTFEWWHESLAMLTASILTAQPRVRIVDFGGAVGLAFLRILAATGRDTPIEHHVVELPNMAAAGRELHGADARIHFHTDIPALDAVDIVYISGVLQYIDDYRDLLGRLARLNARYVLIGRLPAGPFPTFAAKQVNLPGQVLACWFFNIPELVDSMRSGGYTLVYESLAGPEYNQENYPSTHRMGRMRVLLFARPELRPPHATV